MPSSSATVTLTRPLYNKDLVVPASKDPLSRKLGLDYLDLYLVHFPVSLKPGKLEFPFKKEYIVEFNMEGVWEAMEECKKLGLVEYIGVSNFSCKKLQRLLSTAMIVPHVEMNPLWQHKKLRGVLQRKGHARRRVFSYWRQSTIWGTNRVLECQVLKDIGREKGKTLAQVCLRWVYEQGVSMLVKSFNKERMKENLKIFYGDLSKEELESISEIPQTKGHPAAEFVSEDKTIQDFWDEEI